ncbi:MAG: phage portal protein [Gammaproteobacteria bacterium]|nr:phage portal protein [Gammaproteobacteria bacterium]
MWPFKTKEVQQNTETKSHTIHISDELSSFLSAGYSGATAASALRIYSTSSAVFIPVDLISEAFSSIDPVIEINGEIIDIHPALDRLKQPNPFSTKKQLFKALAVEKLVTGECFPVAVGNPNRPPLELYAISPTNTNPVQGVDGAPQSYQVTGQTLTGVYNRVSDKSRVRFIADGLKEVQHIRGYSVKNNSLMRADSPLIAASQEARQHILGNNHNINILEKGGRVSLVFHFEDDMDEDMFENTRARVRSQYGGTQGEAIGVTAGPKMDIKNIGATNLDMDFLNLHESARNACAQTYHVPLALMTVDAATLDNYKQAITSLYDWAVLPLADSLFAGLTQLLLPRYDLDILNAKITYDKKKITALTARTLEELAARVALNLETDNELRPMLGREQIGSIGDVIRKPANMIPVDSDLFTTDAKLNADE